MKGFRTLRIQAREEFRTQTMMRRFEKNSCFNACRVESIHDSVKNIPIMWITVLDTSFFCLMKGAVLRYGASLLIFLMALSLFEGSAMAETPTLHVLLGNTGTAPYLEHTPGDILATVNAAVLGQLIETDENFDIRPGLLESWQWDFSKKAYVLTLKEGLKFHNGRSVSASDLEFALVRGFFSKQHSFYGIFLGNIDGIDAVRPGTPFRSGAVSGVRVSGHRTVEVRLRDPNPSFVHSLVNPFFSLVPIEEMNPDYITWKRFPIGAGPYRVSGPGFHDGRLELTKTQTASAESADHVVLYTSIVQKTFDVTHLRASSIDLSAMKSQRTEYPSSVTTLFLSNLNPLSKFLAFRRALHHAINRKSLSEGLSHYCKPTFEMLPSHFWGRAGLKDPYDPQKAKELLKAVPSALHDQEWPIPVFSGKHFSSEYETIFSRLNQQLREIGIRFKFYPSAEKFISKNTALESPVAAQGRVSDYVDPLIMFASLHTCSPY